MVVMDQPGELKPSQINGLAKALRRSKDAVKSMIEDAQEKFRANADFYVETHKAATQAALNMGSVAGLEVATKSSQWAMERISGEGARIVEKAGAEAGPAGPRVMIGIRVGGIDATKPVDVTATEVPQ